jgi:hypothetical protein
MAQRAWIESQCRSHSESDDWKRISFHRNCLLRILERILATNAPGGPERKASEVFMANIILTESRVVNGSEVTLMDASSILNVFARILPRTETKR